MRLVEQNNFGLDVAYIKLEKGYTLADDKPINNPADAVKAVADVLKDLDKEVICLVTLKNNNTPINASIVSVGTANAAFIFPRDIMKTTLLSNATSILVFHNHPSGGAMPSVDDIRFTDSLKQCCDLMGIKLHDHIIIGAASKEWFSFAEKQLIKPSALKFAEKIEDINLEQTSNNDVTLSAESESVNTVAEQKRTYRR